MSVDDTTVSFSLEINLEPALTNIRKLQTVLYRTLGLLRRMSGNEDLDRAIAKAQRIIAVINMMRLAYAAFMAASGPLGWALAGISIAEAGFAFTDLTYEVGNR